MEEEVYGPRSEVKGQSTLRPWTLDHGSWTFVGLARGHHWIHLKYMLTGIAAKTTEMMMLKAAPASLMIGV